MIKPWSAIKLFKSKMKIHAFLYWNFYISISIWNYSVKIIYEKVFLKNSFDTEGCRVPQNYHNYGSFQFIHLHCNMANCCSLIKPLTWLETWYNWFSIWLSTLLKKDFITVRSCKILLLKKTFPGDNFLKAIIE